MKKYIELITPLILIGFFVVSCGITVRLQAFYFADKGYIQIEETGGDTPTEYKQSSSVLVFTPPNNIDAVSYYLLEAYLVDHKEYSFLMPKGEYEYYNAKLIESVQKDNRENYPTLKVEQISDERQLIELRINGDKRNYTTRYEATDKNVVLKAYKKEDLGETCQFFIVGIIVGVLSIYAVKFLLKKFVNSNIKEVIV